MAKKLLRTYVGLAALGVASVLLAIGASGGCATGNADSFGGAGGAGNSTASSTSTKSAGSTTSTNATTTTSTKASSGSGGVCGNGVCSQDESCQTCPADCTCGAVCGNGTCDTGETCDMCPADCPTGCTSGSMSTGSSTMCHDPCTTGAPMDAATCGMTDPGIGFVCMFPAPIGDPSCCTTAWSSNCVTLYDGLIGC